MKTGITWNQPLGLDECPYARRWVLNLKVCSFRVHHWMKSDDPRYLHDHPWWFLTFVVRGGYYDHSTRKVDRVGRFRVRFRPAHHSHYVDPDPDTWTVLVTGPERHKWGFWVNGKKKAVRSFFWKYGHPPCE